AEREQPHQGMPFYGDFDGKVLTPEDFLKKVGLDSEESKRGMASAEDYIQRLNFHHKLGLSNRADLVRYIRGLEVRACKFRKGFVRMDLMKTISGKRMFDSWSRDPHSGEQCLYDPEHGEVISLLCGNTLEVRDVTPAPSPKEV